MEKSEKVKIVKNAIGTYLDFPKPGIVFRDVFGILKNVKATAVLKEMLIERAALLDIDIIVGLDSRGFLFGPLISAALEKPFIPIRKKGKLPGNVLSQVFTLEYGQASFEIQADTLNTGKKVLIVDDLLATGGSLSAAVELCKMTGAQVTECLVVIELRNLNGCEKIGAPVHSIVSYD